MREISANVSQRHWALSRLRNTLLGIAVSLTLVGMPAVTDASPTARDAPGRFAARQTEDEGGERPLTLDEMKRCLLGSWMHSVEEDTDEVLVFRPEDYPFPPAHGRVGYEFIAAGYLVYYGFGPADEPEVWNGRWEMLSRLAVAIDVNQAPGPNLKETLRIASCSDELLEISR